VAEDAVDGGERKSLFDILLTKEQIEGILKLQKYEPLDFNYDSIPKPSMGVSSSPGRGSAAGSVVAYCLKITNIDPLMYNLLLSVSESRSCVITRY
jgi:hypothetical protein